MAFIQISGPRKQEFAIAPASTAFDAGQSLIMSSGKLAAGTNAATSFRGVMTGAIRSTDSDYASDKTVSFDALDPESEFEADIGAGTYSQSLDGTQCDLYDKNSVDVGTNTHHQVTIIRAGSSSTKVIVKFNSSYIFRNAS